MERRELFPKPSCFNRFRASTECGNWREKKLRSISFFLPSPKMYCEKKELWRVIVYFSLKPEKCRRIQPNKKRNFRHSFINEKKVDLFRYAAFFTIRFDCYRIIQFFRLKLLSNILLFFFRGGGLLAPITLNFPHKKPGNLNASSRILSQNQSWILNQRPWVFWNFYSALSSEIVIIILKKEPVNRLSLSRRSRNEKCRVFFLHCQFIFALIAKRTWKDVKMRTEWKFY